MFENKVLVNLYILSLGTNFEIYIPVNEKVGNISKLINSTMFVKKSKLKKLFLIKKNK